MVTQVFHFRLTRDQWLTEAEDLPLDELGS